MNIARPKAYSPGCGDCGGAHVVVDELGRPYRQEWFSDQFRRLFKADGLPMIWLHDARHTSVTLMILQGAPIPVVSAWHGHSSASFTMATDAHSQDEALAKAGPPWQRPTRPHRPVKFHHPLDLTDLSSQTGL